MQNKLNPNYQRFSKLSQEIFIFICLVVKKENEIRSVTIARFLDSILKTKVTISWINQIIRREGIKRPQGRPTNEYFRKEKEFYFAKIEIIYQETVDKLGIPLTRCYDKCISFSCNGKVKWCRILSVERKEMTDIMLRRQAR